MRLLTLEHTFDSGKFINKSIKYVCEKKQTKYLNYFLTKNQDCRLHKEVLTLAQDDVELKFNKKMIEVLNNLNCNISKSLLSLNEKSGVKSIFANIKASTKHKDSVMFDTPYTPKKGNLIKVGRFVKKLLELNEITVTDVEIEEFSCNFYAECELDRKFEMKIVKGEEIRRLYNEKNYHSEGGSLGNSCMRYYYCEDNFDLYVHNKQISMLVYMNKETGKISGRAILWGDSELYSTTGEVIKTTFMDRIYTNNNKQAKFFHDYAKKNNWIRKARQSYCFKNDFIYDETNVKGRILTNVENNYRHSTRPYLDTFGEFYGNYQFSNGFNF